MPGLDLNQISSNWKRLQEKLQAEKAQEGQNNGLKRRRTEEKVGLVNGHKRTKLSDQRPVKPPKDRKMGIGGSKSEVYESNTNGRSNLAMQHDISQDDLSAAYGKPNGAARTYDDDVNGGLHPTAKVGKYIALDCEMVGTGPPPHLDHVLARVSLVNYHGEQIYDSYVQPPAGIEVKDYRTHVSGIKPHHLKPGFARPLPEVQKAVAALLHDRILVGHALRNDLKTLFLSHSERDRRDTSRYSKFRERSMGKPPALRHLAKDVLGMEIQTGEHSSIEDARVAMMLFKIEKKGFEEENRKRFGSRVQARQPAGKKANGSAALNGQAAESGSEDEDEEDLDLLDGEEDGMSDGGIPVSKEAMPAAKKKRKKKKRTKRK